MKTEYLGVRLTKDQAHKLDQMAVAARRGRGDVIRTLIERVDPAALAPQPIEIHRVGRAA